MRGSVRRPPAATRATWALAGLAAVAPLGACARGPDATTAEVRVAAASDLAVALSELGPTFTTRTGQRVAFTFGSTGLFAHQLRSGAPFDVFAAASAEYADGVIAADACDGATRAEYARGRLALWSRRGRGAPPARLEDLADARFLRVAIAQPEHAPYGRAAREALRSAGLWETLAPRLVYAENVRQALQLAETGNVEAAIVALSLVVKDRVNPWLALDERAYPPLVQVLVVCRHGENREGGEAFARFLVGEAGRSVLREHGFLLPEVASAERP